MEGNEAGRFDGHSIPKRHSVSKRPASFPSSPLSDNVIPNEMIPRIRGISEMRDPSLLAELQLLKYVAFVNDMGLAF